MSKPVISATSIQIPADLRDWLDAKANKEMRSLNKQIILILTQQRDAEVKATEAA